MKPINVLKPKFRTKEVLAETASKTNNGAGTCVGLPLERHNVKIIKMTNMYINPNQIIIL